MFYNCWPISFHFARVSLFGYWKMSNQEPGHSRSLRVCVASTQVVGQAFASTKGEMRKIIPYEDPGDLSGCSHGLSS